MEVKYKMKWWKRLIFSIISLVIGYASVNYLYFAFTKLTDASGSAGLYKIEGEGVMQLVGAAMFLIYFVVLAFYFWVIRRSSPHIDIIEEDTKTGEKKVKKKYFDIVLQIVFILTGMIIRWFYVMYVYIPSLM